MTPKQIQFVRGLLRRTGQEEEKESLVLAYTDGRTTHLSEMTHQETQALIRALGVAPSPRDKMVRKILSMAHDMNWETPGDRKVDMDRVNAWCEKYTPQKCPLNEVSEQDLPKVVTAFERMLEGFLKSV